MPMLVDPRSGDFEDDASSTEQRRLLAIAGSMLAEVSIFKFAATWLVIVAIPALMIGVTIPLLSIWLTKVSDRVLALTGLGSTVILIFLLGGAWFGIRPLFRVAESNFWALQSIVVQPCYALARETIRHAAEISFFSNSSEATRANARANVSLIAAVICALTAVMVVAFAWPYSRWNADFRDLNSVTSWIWPAIANAVVVVTVYFGLFSIGSGISDALMDQPARLSAFDIPKGDETRIRVAHVSDLHVIGEPYGFRIESGRAGPQGNSDVERLFRQICKIHQDEPLDLILITGDITDAGKSSEWAAFFDILERHPDLMQRTLVTPGNHDLNIVDRANPARLELPVSARKRLRQLRTLSAMERIQGARVRVFDRKARRVGPFLSEAIAPHRKAIEEFVREGAFMGAYRLSPLWADCFPLVAPPLSSHGIGVIILDSNADANFSFTNALGVITAEDLSALVCIIEEFPGARWIIALHHHLVEYPMRVTCFSERIGTSLINGSWFLRQLKPFSNRIVIMHGHRHIDWIGDCGGLKIVSAPSPVMQKHGTERGFLVHSLFAGADGAIGLAAPRRFTTANTNHSGRAAETSEQRGA